MKKTIITTKRRNKKQTFLEKWSKKIMLYGSIAAALVSLAGVFSVYDSYDLPRPALKSEVVEVQIQTASSEIDARIRSKRSDERTLWEIDQQIQKYNNAKQPIPSSLMLQRQRIIEDMNDNDNKLKKALQKLK